METFEAMQSRHRKEQKDLQSRVMNKKKNATKKTRKGVNSECEELERQLKEKQGLEVVALNGEPADVEDVPDLEEDMNDEPSTNGVNGITQTLDKTAISEPEPSED